MNKATWTMTSITKLTWKQRIGKFILGLSLMYAWMFVAISIPPSWEFWQVLCIFICAMAYLEMDRIVDMTFKSVYEEKVVDITDKINDSLRKAAEKEAMENE